MTRFLIDVAFFCLGGWFFTHLPPIIRRDPASAEYLASRHSLPALSFNSAGGAARPDNLLLSPPSGRAAHTPAEQT